MSEIGSSKTNNVIPEFVFHKLVYWLLVSTFEHLKTVIKSCPCVYAPRNNDVWGRGGKAPPRHYRSEWSASPSGSFIPGKKTQLPI
jgi:hypothetical protein